MELGYSPLTPELIGITERFGYLCVRFKPNDDGPTFGIAYIDLFDEDDKVDFGCNVSYREFWL